MATGETVVILRDGTGVPHLDVVPGGGLRRGPLAVVAGTPLLQELVGDCRRRVNSARSAGFAPHAEALHGPTSGRLDGIRVAPARGRHGDGPISRGYAA